MSRAAAAALLLAGCSTGIYWPRGVDFVGCGDVDVDALDVAIDDAVAAWPDVAGEASRLQVRCHPRAAADDVCGNGAESCALARASDRRPAIVAISDDVDGPAQLQHELAHLRGEGPAFFCPSHATECWPPALPCEASSACTY